MLNLKIFIFVIIITISNLLIKKAECDNQEFVQHLINGRTGIDAKRVKGDWLVIQKRQDGSEDFYRNWEDYENGFGNIEGEFFIGLKMLHALTNYNVPQELLIIMEDASGTRAYAHYNYFAIGDETESYKLKSLGQYTGTAGNSLSYHLGMKFTTKDRDNDLDPDRNCAVEYTGAWWYNSCQWSNLNGKYGSDDSSPKGIAWHSFRNYESLPYVVMMIRPTTASNTLAPPFN